jgi:transposase
VIARTILAGELVPNEAIYELRLLVRHRWRLMRVLGMILRYAISLVDRIFPEYEGIFCNPFLTSVRTLIRKVGLTPKVLVAKKDEVRHILETASRKRISKELIENLLRRAEESMGTRQGSEVVNRQLRMIVEYFDFLEGQIEQINEVLRKRMKEMDCLILSLGVGAEIAAAILAESGNIVRFPGPSEYVAFCGLDTSVRDSGDSIHGRSHISKRGSPLLRWAMYMTAQTVVKKHHDFARIYKKNIKTKQKGKRKKGHRYAMIVVAHKVARVIWRLIKDKRNFEKKTPKRQS